MVQLAISAFKTGKYSDLVLKYLCENYTGATHVLQWGVQRAATTRVDANPKNLSQFGLESATRLHEAGFASNRASGSGECFEARGIFP